MVDEKKNENGNEGNNENIDLDKINKEIEANENEKVEGLKKEIKEEIKEEVKKEVTNDVKDQLTQEQVIKQLQDKISETNKQNEELKQSLVETNKKLEEKPVQRKGMVNNINPIDNKPKGEPTVEDIGKLIDANGEDAFIKTLTG